MKDVLNNVSHDRLKPLHLIQDWPVWLQETPLGQWAAFHLDAIVRDWALSGHIYPSLMDRKMPGVRTARPDIADVILTVHHLDMNKWNCQWWNLAALCQRCHLQIQNKVKMAQVYPLEHSEWFKPYAAGFYAWSYRGLELTREETMERLDEFLALELVG